MNTQAFHIAQRQLHRQSRQYLVYGFIAACLINLFCIVGLSQLSIASSEPEIARRLHQIQQTEKIKEPQRQREQVQQQQQSIQEALPALSSVNPDPSEHQFSFPHDPYAAIQPTQWRAGMDLSSFAAMQEIVLDKRARLKYIPDLGRFYPREAKQKGITGYTLLELQIDDHGNVTSYTIKESMPLGVFEQQIDKIIPHIRYEAAELNGQPHADQRLFKLSWSVE